MARTIEIATRSQKNQNPRYPYKVNPVYWTRYAQSDGSKNNAEKQAQAVAGAWKYSRKPLNIMGSSVHNDWNEEHSATRGDDVGSESDAQPPAKVVNPFRNGFLQAVIAAYSSHHHLTISPDDVWIAILTQFNFYVNAHAEELRAHFVSHEGQENIHVEGWPVGGPTATEAFAAEMVKGIAKKVTDPELTDWILPDFTTTKPNDTIVCSVLMMSTLKAYFTYSGGVCCGVPSITLEGEKSDWESIYARLDKLTSFGAEPTQWAALLRPILRRFVRAFDLPPDSDSQLDFWERICHYEAGSGFDHLSGWISAFAVWDNNGKWLGGNPHAPAPVSLPGALVLDQVTYPDIGMSDLPQGFADVDLVLMDDGAKIETKLVAGHLGCEASGKEMDCIRPYSAWFLVVDDKK